MSNDEEVLVRSLLQAKVIAALNSTPDYIEKLITAAMSKPVDEHGKPTNYNGKPYLDWLVGDEIRSAARVAVIEIIKGKAGEIETQIRQRIDTEGLAVAIAKALAKTVSEEWRVNIEFAKPER